MPPSPRCDSAASGPAPYLPGEPCASPPAAVISRRALQFVAFACLVSWTIGALLFVFRDRLGPVGALVLAVAYMFGPLVAALIVRPGTEPVARWLGVSWRLNAWWGIAWLLPVLLVAATLGINLLWPGTSFSPEMAGMFERYGDMLSHEDLEEMERQVASLPVHPFWLGLVQGLLAGATINALAAFGEEAGWRGVLLGELAPLGFWKSSLVIGAVWGLWHAPLILQGHNYPQHPVAGVFMMIGFTMLLAPLIGYVRLRARSVVPAAVMHGTVNGIAGLSILVVAGGSDLSVGLTGLSGLLVLAAATALLFAYERHVPGASAATLLREHDRSAVRDMPEELDGCPNAGESR
jgi:uncharacterized protein